MPRLDPVSEILTVADQLEAVRRLRVQLYPFRGYTTTEPAGERHFKKIERLLESRLHHTIAHAAQTIH